MYISFEEIMKSFVLFKKKWYIDFINMYLTWYKFFDREFQKC